MNYLSLIILSLQLFSAGGIGVNFPLVLYGLEYGDSTLPMIDDGSSSLISLSVSFPYFGNNERDLYFKNEHGIWIKGRLIWVHDIYDQYGQELLLQLPDDVNNFIKVITNGILTFRAPYLDYTPKNFDQILWVLIAPYWADSDIRLFGHISFRTLNTCDQTSNLQQIISRTFAIPNFECRQVFVATYHQVPPFMNFPNIPNANNTFQVVLVTDGDLSFVLFSYGDIQWSGGANIGFNSGNRSFMLPEALTSAVKDIETTSNVGVPGLYIYRVDQDSIEEPAYNYTTIKRGGNPGRVYSNSCPSQQDNEEVLLDVLNFLSIQFGVIPLGLAKTYAAISCEQIASSSPQSKAGMYWITNGTTTQHEYCNF